MSPSLTNRCVSMQAKSYLDYAIAWKVPQWHIWNRMMLCDIYLPESLPGSKRWSSSENKEYLMVYGGPGLLTVVWFGSSLTPSHSSPVSQLSLILRLPVCCRSSLLMGEGCGRGRGRSHIIRRRERQVICKSLNTPWVRIFTLRPFELTEDWANG